MKEPEQSPTFRSKNGPLSPTKKKINKRSRTSNKTQVSIDLRSPKSKFSSKESYFQFSRTSIVEPRKNTLGRRKEQRKGGANKNSSFRLNSSSIEKRRSFSGSRGTSNSPVKKRKFLSSTNNKSSFKPIFRAKNRKRINQK